MRIRRIGLLLLTLMLLASFCFTTAAADFANLTAVGISAEIDGKTGDDYITREEFSYLAAKLLSSEDRQATATKFEDVTESNPYSGYIRFLTEQNIINGVTPTQFQPQGNISATAAAKMMVHILGFDYIADSWGGYPAGYLKTADKLELFTGVNRFGEALTCQDAFMMFENLLLAANGNVDYSIELLPNGVEETQFHNWNNNFLTTQLHYSVYQGTVLSTDSAINRVDLYLERSMYESNYLTFLPGQTVQWQADERVSVFHYEGVPVTVWLNADGDIVSMKERVDYEILYAYITSVNGDERENSAYLTSGITRLSVEGTDKEYRLHTGAQIYYNSLPAPSRVSLTGTFAKLILQGNRIEKVYAWNMTEGGLIQSVNTANKTFTCIDGSRGKKQWTEAEDSEAMIVYIDGRRASFEEIKPDSVFEYYVSSPYCILTVSERIAVDVFQGITNDELLMGAFEYPYRNCWFAKEAESYSQATATINQLLTNEVVAYFGPDGYVKYVISSGGTSAIRSFYAVISGVKRPTGLEEDTLLELYVLEDEITKDTYTLTDRTRYQDGLSLSTVTAASADLSGAGVFRFTINRNNKITEVANCTPFSGYGSEAKATLTRFTDEVIPVVDVNGKQLYFEGTQIVALYQQDGKFAATYVPWLDIYSRAINGTATMTFYSEEETPQPELAVLCGDVADIADNTLGIGIVLKKSIVLDDSEEYVNEIQLLSNGGQATFRVSDSVAATLYPNAFVVYQKKAFDENDQLLVTQVLDVSGDIGQWEVSVSPNSGLQRGVVRKMDSKRLYIESSDNNEVYFMHPYHRFLASATSGGGSNKFSTITTDEINVGDTVCYYIYGGELRAILVQK